MKLILYILESILCGGLLLAFYQMLLARKASYRFCRFWLLASAVLAVAIPALRLPVFPYGSPAATFINTVESTSLVLETGTPGSTADAAALGGVSTSGSRFSLTEWIVLGIYASVALVLLALIVYRILKIRALRRASKLIRTESYTLAEHAAIHSPFSFGKTLYIGPNIAPEDRAMVIAHEASHIAHCHTTEKLFLSVLKSLFWFNPFLWLSERYLVEVQEYQADADVLGKGYGLQEYRYAIFRQLFGHEPDIASAMGHSLTRKRFERMGNDSRKASVPLRVAGACVLIAALLIAFGTAARPRYIPYAKERDGVGILDEIVITKYLEPGTKASGLKAESHFLPVPQIEGVTPWGELPVKPVFSSNLVAWGTKNLTYPDDCMKQGTVEVSFTVDDNGGIGNVALIQGVGDPIDEMVLTLVRDHFPQTLPATAKDTSFAMAQCILPVTFQIKGPLATRWDSGVVALQKRLLPLSPTEIDEKPLFAEGKGTNEFSQWVQSKLTYSDEVRQWSRETNHSGGLTVCQFTLTKSGKIRNARILRGSDSPMDKEVLRVVRTSPKWEQAARKEGKNVAVRYNLPIFFKIPDN